MVVIIIRPTTVPSILIQLPRQKGIGPPIVLDRIKNRNSVRRHSNRSPKEVRLGRHPNFRGNWIERNRPSIS